MLFFDIVFVFMILHIRRKSLQIHVYFEQMVKNRWQKTQNIFCYIQYFVLKQKVLREFSRFFPGLSFVRMLWSSEGLKNPEIEKNSLGLERSWEKTPDKSFLKHDGWNGWWMNGFLKFCDADADYASDVTGDYVDDVDLVVRVTTMTTTTTTFWNVLRFFFSNYSFLVIFIISSPFLNATCIDFCSNTGLLCCSHHGIRPTIA